MDGDRATDAERSVLRLRVTATQAAEVVTFSSSVDDSLACGCRVRLLEVGIDCWHLLSPCRAHWLRVIQRYELIIDSAEIWIRIG